MKRKLVMAAVFCVLAGAALMAARRPGGKVENSGKQAPMCDLSEESLRKKLSPEQYKIVRENGTEVPFNNKYWNNKEPGLYVDVVSGTPLFSSTDKFDSGSGWPSFTAPLDQKAVKTAPDDSMGMSRTEVRSSAADSHLGHVFDDGPGPGGLRYCINSAALRFVPVKDLEKEGLGSYMYMFPKEAEKLGYERATFAGGCFWGVQAYFKKVPGVVSVRAGYAAGTGGTGGKAAGGRAVPAEAVDIIFDPKKVPYKRLLAHFWTVHDPTTLNRQGNDVGPQYRAAVFYHGPKQKEDALRSKRGLESSGRYKSPVVTAVEAAAGFQEAEEHHQDYLDKHPGGYCHIDLSGAEREDLEVF